MKPMYEEPVGQLEAAARAIASGHRRSAAAWMRRVASPLPEAAVRRSVSERTRARVFQRDCFTCCYCGARTIPEPVMRMLSLLFPSELPWHAHWKSTETHPLYYLISSSCEHVVAGARHGDWGGGDNLITACALCNYSKSSYTLTELGRAQPRRRESDWRGLTDIYDELLEVAKPENDRYFRTWQRAFAAAEAENGQAHNG